MFTHKYKPKTVQEVVGLSDSVINNINKDMKHMLFISAVPGTGKTTTADAIQRQLDCDTLRLNGSDTRGIDTIRTLVKEFAMTGKTKGDFKLIRIEEMDYLTKEAQAMLRELMEIYEKNCRFIFTANYRNKIIQPLQSRCMVIDFGRASKEDIRNKLISICTRESINAAVEVLDKIIEKYNPDIRSMINKLEELSKKGKEITVEMIDIDEDKIKALVEHLKNKKYKEARLWVLNSNEESSYIINSLFRYIEKSDMISSKKLEVIKILAETEFRLGLCVDKEVQMAWGLVNLIKAMV